MTRGRHVAVEANYGGRKCSGNKMELTTCLHEDMGKKEKSKDAIYYCPGEEFTLFLTRQINYVITPLRREERVGLELS